MMILRDNAGDFGLLFGWWDRGLERGQQQQQKLDKSKGLCVYYKDLRHNCNEFHQQINNPPNGR